MSVGGEVFPFSRLEQLFPDFWEGLQKWFTVSREFRVTQQEIQQGGIACGKRRNGKNRQKKEVVKRIIITKKTLYVFAKKKRMYISDQNHKYLVYKVAEVSIRRCLMRN